MLYALGVAVIWLFVMQVAANRSHKEDVDRLEQMIKQLRSKLDEQ